MSAPVRAEQRRLGVEAGDGAADGVRAVANRQRGMRGRSLAALRRRCGLRQQDVAPFIPKANGHGPIDDTLLSRIENEDIRLPRGFSALYLDALEQAMGVKAREFEAGLRERGVKIPREAAWG